jgi:hypothetical protein
MPLCAPSVPPAVWVYCGDQQLCGAHHKECWLKHLAHPYGTAPAKEGPEVGWTTGILTPRDDSAADGGVSPSRWTLPLLPVELLQPLLGCSSCSARLGASLSRASAAHYVTSPAPGARHAHHLSSRFVAAVRCCQAGLPCLRASPTNPHGSSCAATLHRSHSRPIALQGDSGDRTFHVVITAAGSAVHWQSRVGADGSLWRPARA